jgi:uncharacterized protein DUF4240
MTDVAEEAEMTKDDFWKLVDGKREKTANETAAAVETALTALPEAEIQSFQEHLDARMSESYDWRLWGAAYLARGGCSDDTFDYFREWLIAQGRETFEMALADPDSLAGIGPDVGETEELLSVAFNAYRRKTKREMPPRKPAPTGEPHGTAWEEDELPGMFPRLQARYG